MSKPPRESARKAAVRRVRTAPASEADFDDVLALIDAAKARTLAVVNKALIEVYWNIGQHISRKTVEQGWGQGTVEELKVVEFEPEHLGKMQFYLEALDRDVRNASLVDDPSGDPDAKKLSGETGEQWIGEERQRLPALIKELAPQSAAAEMWR
jgi:hypothetical protein